MKKIYLGLLIMLLGISSQSAMANTFATVSSYVPSWQTVRGSLPPAAYWPSITAGTMAILGLKAMLGGEPGLSNTVSRSIVNAYMTPYVLAHNLYLLQQFMVVKHYTVGDLLRPSVRRQFYSYLNNKGLGLVAASGYYFYFPLVLLLGGHLYHTYR